MHTSGKSVSTLDRGDLFISLESRCITCRSKLKRCSNYRPTFTLFRLIFRFVIASVTLVIIDTKARIISCHGYKAFQRLLESNADSFSLHRVYYAFSSREVLNIVHFHHSYPFVYRMSNVKSSINLLKKRSKNNRISIILNWTLQFVNNWKKVNQAYTFYNKKHKNR